MCTHDLPLTSYRILAFFEANAHSSVSVAASAMPDVKAVELRITELTPEYLSQDYEKQLNGDFTTHHYFDTFCITPLGEKVLQDFETSQKSHQKEVWLVNAKIPLVVSIITNLLISGIGLLLSLIL